jgi:hypothetical protein
VMKTNWRKLTQRNCVLYFSSHCWNRLGKILERAILRIDQKLFLLNSSWPFYKKTLKIFFTLMPWRCVHMDLLKAYLHGALFLTGRRRTTQLQTILILAVRCPMAKINVLCK